MALGGHGTVAANGGGIIGGIAGGFSGDLGADLGAEAGLIELLLLLEEAALLLSRHLLVHPLVLPLVEATRERSGAAAHRPEQGEAEQELREGSGALSKEGGGHDYVRGCARNRHGSETRVLGFGR